MWYRKAEAEITKPEWEMTPDEFAEHHYTGHINSGAYDTYRTPEGMSWIRRDMHTEPHKTIMVNGEPVEILLRREPNKFVKWENDDIVRDAQGLATYLTDEEVLAKGYDLESVEPAAFHGDKAVGFASNEWGASGAWVADDYQRHGIGTELLHALRTLNPRLQKNKLGQMTNAGYGMAKKYHKKIVEDAIAQGKPVSREILELYPDLLS